MQEGNHEVRTAWGFLAVRLPMPEDPQWTADRVTILQALGVLDPAGKPTDAARRGEGGRRGAARPGLVADGARQDGRRPATSATPPISRRSSCSDGDDMIKNADHLMAQGIRDVAALYKDGVLPKPANYPYAFPDLLTFHDAPTVVEQKLFVMFLEHRMRTFQGTFHASPDYALWYGWSEMQRDLTEIKELSAQMRREHQSAAK